MKKKLIAILVAAGFASPAFAQTVVITVDNETDSRSLTLESFVFDGQTLTVQAASSGSTTPPPTSDPVEITRTLTVTAPSNGTIINNATNQPVTSQTFTYMSDQTAPSISMRLVANSGYQAASWGGSCSGINVGSNCTLSMSNNRTVSATFQSSTSTGSCGSTPSGTTVLQTAPSGSTFLGTISNSATTTSTIHAYQFNSGPSKYIGRTVATRVTNGEGKLVVITECPGQINQPVSGGKCSTYSSESSTIWYSTDPSSSTRTYCVLDPNKTYYANVVNASSFTGSPKCVSNCGFYFQKD